jgi:hypothetical protein
MIVWEAMLQKFQNLLPMFNVNHIADSVYILHAYLTKVPAANHAFHSLAAIPGVSSCTHTPF